jgi:hypothetical protein
MCNPVTTAYPEALLSKGTHAGFEWEVTNNGLGYRCGYVRVPPGHPWHGQDAEQPDVDVHGGLTFAEADTDCGKGGADNAWWLGFDCAHAYDAPDPSLPLRDGREGDAWFHERFPDYGTIRTTSYVEAECRRLAEQAAAAMSAPLETDPNWAGPVHWRDDLLS